jgi:hypothetical protein
VPAAASASTIATTEENDVITSKDRRTLRARLTSIVTPLQRPEARQSAQDHEGPVQLKSAPWARQMDRPSHSPCYGFNSTALRISLAHKRQPYRAELRSAAWVSWAVCWCWIGKPVLTQESDSCSIGSA